MSRQVVRISFTHASTDRRVALLGAFGFHAKAISRETGLTTGQVYARLKRAAIRLRDYRDMQGEFAPIIVRRSEQMVSQQLTRCLPVNGRKALNGVV